MDILNIGLKVWTGALLSVSVLDAVVDILKMGLKPDASREGVLVAAAVVVVAVLDEAVDSRLKRPGAGAGGCSEAAVAETTTEVEAGTDTETEAGTIRGVDTIRGVETGALVFRDTLASV